MLVLATFISWMVLSLKSFFVCFFFCGLIRNVLVRPGNTMSVFTRPIGFLSQVMFFKSGLFGFLSLLFQIRLNLVTTRLVSAVLSFNLPTARIQTSENVHSYTVDHHEMTSADWNRRLRVLHLGSWVPPATSQHPPSSDMTIIDIFRFFSPDF